MSNLIDESQYAGRTFDMYHFFSRWDVWLMIAMILMLLGYVVISHFTGEPV